MFSETVAAYNGIHLEDCTARLHPELMSESVTMHANHYLGRLESRNYRIGALTSDRKARQN